MKFTTLSATITTPHFTTEQVQKLFRLEATTAINTQLNRFVRRGDLVRLKRGLFVFPQVELDEFVTAGLLYPQSYVSLESALHIYNLIPDVTMQVTSVTPVTSKKIQTTQDTFLYSKIKRSLYFGFQKLRGQLNQLYYQIAEPEKAVLDYIYLRSISKLAETRLELDSLDQTKLKNYASYFPRWVREVLKHE